MVRVYHYADCCYVRFWRPIFRTGGMSCPDLEIPLGKRSKLYRFFEMLPALISYGMLILLVVLSVLSPFLAAIYLLLLVLTTFVKAIGISYRTLLGHRQLVRAEKIDWSARLDDLSQAAAGKSPEIKINKKDFEADVHQQTILSIEKGELQIIDPRDIYHAVLIAAYNESYEVLKPTVESVNNTTYPNERLIVYLAYEERGGEQMAETARRLRDEYAGVFCDFRTIQHPKDLPDEIPGKGPNITYAGYDLKQWCDNKKIKYNQVIVTTLDSDNRPYLTYFDYVAYKYAVTPNRERLSYQPVALYFGNIWDAPAPMRVLATGNSFWTIIGSMRPHALRNFAAHSQPLSALVSMDFWSKRSIVEDGHQYWRSYFYFKGDYSVMPIHVPVYQDAVLSDTFKATLISQFKQLRRWGYGASDIPYVAVRLFTRQRTAPFWETLARFIRLIDNHVSLATMSILVAFGAWVPLLTNPEASRNISAHALPLIVSHIQQVAVIGIFITILLMLKMLPPRPERYKRSRTVFMVLQWFLMPVTSICYSSAASMAAQTHLLLGKYLEKFDVTDKATLSSRAKTKAKKDALKKARRKSKL